MQDLKLAEGGKRNSVQRLGKSVGGKLASLFSSEKKERDDGAGAGGGANLAEGGDEPSDGESDVDMDND